MQILDQLTDNLLFIVCTNDHSKSFLLIINFFFWSAAKKAKEDPFYPDRVIPQKVLERSVEVIQQGVACHYTPPIGNADLKEVIAKKIERDNHIKVNPQRNIIINPGSDVGLYFAMTPFIEPGDEVLVHDPSYPSNFLDPQLLNGVVVKVPTYEEDNYRLRVEE